jgi:preprotein translocase subunit SecY
MKNQRKNNILKKIIFTILIIILLRIGNIIPVPNVDQKYLVNLVNSNLTLKPFFNNKNIILSVFSVGIIPNLNASILIQYLTSSFSYFQKLQKEEGETGRRQIKQYTRTLTVIFAFIQSLSITLALRPILFNWNIGSCFEIILVLMTGSMIVLWLSDLITESGIGNGSSIVITLNILSGLPNVLTNIIKSENNNANPYNFLSLIILIIGIVYLQEAVKIVPLITINQLLKKNKNVKQVSYLPIKVNQGGVMPIIFASTILGFLFIIFNSIINFLHISVDPFLIRIIYTTVNFLLVFNFTIFYSNLILNPKEIAKDLNKMGVTIKNVRPGQQTVSFLKKTLNRLTKIGAIFLATLVTIPNIGSYSGLSITSLIIAIGVILEVIRQIQILKRE